ncbi:hypothetical protein, partial [Bacteroides caecicola]|uniref:hypothetical protein n=1 Tax=Bacteroides caecicola TaxID=1462569 RepID=UPI00195D048B
AYFCTRFRERKPLNDERLASFPHFGWYPSCRGPTAPKNLPEKKLEKSFGGMKKSAYLCNAFPLKTTRKGKDREVIEIL